MSRSSSGVHRPELATRWPPGSMVQLPAPRRLARWPVSAQLPVGGGDRGPADPQRLGQLPLGRQADAQRQPAVGEQTAYRGGQRGVVGAAPAAGQGVPLPEQPGQLDATHLAGHGHLPRNWLFADGKLALRVACMARDWQSPDRPARRLAQLYLGPRRSTGSAWR